MATNNNRIGEKLSFWDLANGSKFHEILIPTIQRDYTYGADTETTNKVLNNMLKKMKSTLFEEGAGEMTMNFVYGFTETGHKYVPLDGQQRLTTLFLLHYYASLYNSEADKNSLERFTYATRETTKEYCTHLITNHKDIKDSLSNFDAISEAISDMPWFIPSYSVDPSIRSMQVVLDKIQKEFAEYKEELWDVLTSTECKINFYLLDFGPFGLSDDL